MKKHIAISAAFVFSLSASQAFAGGWGGNNAYGLSSGLVNVSPTVSVGGVANGAAILSGNTTGSGILSGNAVGTSVNGVLSGIGVNLFGGSKHKK